MTKLCVCVWIQFCVQKCRYTYLLLSPFSPTIFKRQGQQRAIPFFPSSAPSSAHPASFFGFSAPSDPSHSFMAEHSSLTSPNKKHTLQLNRRGHPHARVTGQARSLTFFRGSPLLAGWDLTFFLFIEKKPPQMFTTASFFPIPFSVRCQTHILKHHSSCLLSFPMLTKIGSLFLPKCVLK